MPMPIPMRRKILLSNSLLILLIQWWWSCPSCSSNTSSAVVVVSAMLIHVSRSCHTRGSSASKPTTGCGCGSAVVGSSSILTAGTTTRGGVDNHYVSPRHRCNKFPFRFLARNENYHPAVLLSSSSSSSSSSSVSSSTTALSSSLSSSSSSSGEDKRQPKQQQQQQNKEITLLRLMRCVSVVMGCCLTWALTHHPGLFLPKTTRRLSSIQASALTGILGSILTHCIPRIIQTTNPSLAAAMFCGSFAGMSTQIHHFPSAMFLGTMTSIVYYVWDAGKVGVGVGGRLGAMALLSNVLWIGVSAIITTCTTKYIWPTDAVHCQGNVVVDIWKRLGGIKTVGPLGILLLTLVTMTRRQLLRDQYHLNHVGQRFSNGKTILQRTVVKSLMMGILGFFSVINNSHGRTVIPLANLALTFAVVYSSSIVIQETAGVVLPVAILGFVGGSLFPPYIAAAMYMGGFIGMTRKPNFKSWQVAQASLIASLALCGAFWTGLGGRLGAQAFIGVLFSLL